MSIRKSLCLTALLTSALLLLSCGMKAEDFSVNDNSAAAVQAGNQPPGTVEGGLYLSPAGDYTLRINEDIWMLKEEEGEQTFHLKQDNNVWVSFSDAQGLTADMLTDFESIFAKRYMEGVRAVYPDALIREQKVINQNLARLDMSMSYGSGLYAMYQIMYLVTDGENGYIATATLPLDKADGIRTDVYEMVESICFLNLKAQEVSRIPGS